MDCEKQLNAFFAIAEAEGLPQSAQIIYIHLMNMNSRLYWREWFKIANSRLKNLTGIASNDTIVAEKNRLKQIGLIDFKSDGKTTTRYHLVPLTGQDTGQDTGHLLDDDAKEMMLKDDERARDNENRNAFSFYENNIHPGMTPHEYKRVSKLLDEYGEEWVIHALERAADNHAHTVAYPEKVLMGWKESGSKEPWKDGGGKGERRMGIANSEGAGRDAEKERADTFREECRRADANQVYPWEVQKSVGGDSERALA